MARMRILCFFENVVYGGAGFESLSSLVDSVGNFSLLSEDMVFSRTAGSDVAVFASFVEFPSVSGA